MTTAVILAGGLGTRLRTVVADVPKPMAPIEGRPFLDYLMAFWHAQGVQRFILSVGYRREIIMAHIGTRFQGVPVDYAVEESPLGTGGGLLLACDQMQDSSPFLVLNGDTFFDVDLAALRQFHEIKNSDWTFSLFQPREADRYMSLDVAEDGAIHALKSGRRDAGGWANGGVYMTTPAAIHRAGYTAGQKLSLEDNFMPALQAKGGVFYGMQCPGYFIDIGLPRDYLRASDTLPLFFKE